MNSKALSRILENPEIKEFLKAYPCSERSEVVKYSILHTIYSLRVSFQSPPGLHQLKDIISNAGKLNTLESTIVQMKSKLEKIKKEVQTMEGSLEKPRPLEKTEKVLKIENNKKDPNTEETVFRSHSAPHITKAPSNWRKGDDHVFRSGFVENHPANTKSFLFRQVSPPQLRDHHYKEFLVSNDAYQVKKDQNASDIYPEWWKALTELDVKPTKITNKVTQYLPPKPSLKTDRKQWVEPYVWHKEPEENLQKVVVPKPKIANNVHFSPKTSEKSAEANFDSIDSTNNEARVRFSDKKYSNWVGDFSKVVKNTTPKPSQSLSKEISYTDSSRKEHSSGYTSSSMTNYVPNSEMRQFYQGEFNRFLESKAGENFSSGRIKSPYHYTISSEDED